MGIVDKNYLVIPDPSHFPDVQKQEDQKQAAQQVNVSPAPFIPFFMPADHLPLRRQLIEGFSVFCITGLIVCILRYRMY